MFVLEENLRFDERYDVSYQPNKKQWLWIDAAQSYFRLMIIRSLHKKNKASTSGGTMVAGRHCHRLWHATMASSIWFLLKMEIETWSFNISTKLVISCSVKRWDDRGLKCHDGFSFRSLDKNKYLSYQSISQLTTCTDAIDRRTIVLILIEKQQDSVENCQHSMDDRMFWCQLIDRSNNSNTNYYYRSMLP